MIKMTMSMRIKYYAISNQGKSFSYKFNQTIAFITFVYYYVLHFVNIISIYL